MIKSYRGLIADDTIHTIPLHTNDGKTGYRIKKLQVMPESDNSIEAILKIFTIPQTATSKTIDFTDNTLLGAVYFSMHHSSGSYPEDQTVVFDNMVFNQDIYITLKCANDIAPLNYYVELEQISLTDDQALVAIVKNLRNEQ